MKVSFNLYTMASLVNGAKYPLQTDEVERITKTLVITKRGLRFNKEKGKLQNSKHNKAVLATYAKEMNNQTLFGADAFLTEESKEMVNSA